MFDSLSDRLGSVFDRLRGRGALTEADVRAAMREVRVALLEADVALPVARDFVDKVTEKAVGQEVIRSVTPGQMVVKIVHDALVETLGSETAELNLDVNPPAVIMMVGLQGSGKTTTTAKLAKRLSETRAQAGADGVARRRPPGRAGAAGGARAPDERRHAADRRRPAAGRYRQARDPGRQAAGLRHRPARHRRPSPRRRCADGRDEGRRAGIEPDRDLARRRQLDRPGRRQRRQGLRRRSRSHRRRADPYGRRRPWRCCAVDARGHRQADQVRRCRRSARQARGLSPGPRCRPHPRHGRRRQPGRACRRNHRDGGCREARGQDGQGQVRPRRSLRRSSSKCSAWAASARSPA